jgi:hypothetical protein
MLIQRKEHVDMFSRIVSVVAVVLALSAGAVLAEAPEKEKAAVVATEKWLTVVDAGKYGESWKQSAEIFRNLLTQDQWERSLQTVRKPLGKVLSRKAKNTRCTTSVSGAPAGEYVVIEFETSFEENGAAVETVTSTLEKDGSWRVSGYYVR